MLQALSTEDVTDAAIEKSQSHQTLRRLLKVWKHQTEPFGLAFILQALTSALQAADLGSNGELGWLLRGLGDIGRNVASIAAPAEDVAMVVFAEAKKMLAAALGRARMQKDDD